MPRNEVLFVMDSVGWWALKDAETPFITGLKPVMAHSSAYWTAPSMYAMLSGDGAIPQPVGSAINPYKFGNMAHRWVPLRFAKRGYNTYFVTSNPLMWNKGAMDYKFKHYHYNMDKGITAPEMIDWFMNAMKEPYFVVFLFVETHHRFLNKDKERKTQLEAISFLDGQAKSLFERLPENTRMIITSDHGEIWNEDGVHIGHNPFKVEIRQDHNLLELLEVFLAIAEK